MIFFFLWRGEIGYRIESEGYREPEREMPTIEQGKAELKEEIYEEKQGGRRRDVVAVF